MIIAAKTTADCVGRITSEIMKKNIKIARRAFVMIN
jgi:hypothetical protein